jgi:hypothetical protein
MDLKFMYTTNKKQFRKLLKLQFKRIDTDNDNLITQNDIIQLFPNDHLAISILFNDHNIQTLNQKQFIKIFIKLIKKLY